MSQIYSSEVRCLRAWEIPRRKAQSGRVLVALHTLVLRCYLECSTQKKKTFQKVVLLVFQVCQEAELLCLLAWEIPKKRMVCRREMVVCCCQVLRRHVLMVVCCQECMIRPMMIVMVARVLRLVLAFSQRRRHGLFGLPGSMRSSNGALKNLVFSSRMKLIQRLARLW